MAWIYLILGGLFEMGWALGLKLSETMQVKVWTGIGAVGTLLVGIFLFGDSAGFWRLFSAGLIVIGVIGLKIAH